MSDQSARIGGRTIGVVIPCHNYGRYLADALRSAIDQTHPPSEIIVVDDASTDDTPRVASSFHVGYLRRATAGGAAAARNAGWRATKTDLVAFLDADDTWLGRKLEIQAGALQAVPDAGLVFCDAYRIDSRTGRITGRMSEISAPHEGHVWRQVLEKNFLQTPTVIIPRTVLEETGGFDESMEAWEDIDLWVRIARRHRFAYVPEPLVQVRVHGGSLSGRALAMARGHLRTTEAAFRDEATLEPWMKRVRAECLAEMGIAHYLAGDMTASRQWLHRAVRSSPGLLLSRHVMSSYAKGLLGAGIVATLREKLRRRSDE